MAQELGNGVLYSDSMCAASNSFQVKLVRGSWRGLTMSCHRVTEATKSWLRHRSQSLSRRRSFWRSPEAIGSPENRRLVRRTVA